MPKKNGFGDVAAGIRKMANRRIAALEKRVAKSGDDFIKKGAEQRIASIRSEMERTYTYDRSTGKKLVRSDTEKRSALVELSRELRDTQYLASERTMRSLEVTRNQLNAASTGAASVYTQEEAKIFFKATQKAWQRPGVDKAHRLEAILEYYGRDNLAELVSDTLTLNTRAVQKSRLETQQEFTEEQEELASEADIAESATYPQYLNDVITPPEPSGIQAPTEE